MTPLHAAAGAVVVAAFLGGAWAGYDYRDAKAGREKAAQAREQIEYVSRNYVSRSVAEAQYQALAGRSTTVLREVLRVPTEPLKCPPDADVRDLVLPGLGDRLRKLRDSTGEPAGADVGAVQP